MAWDLSDLQGAKFVEEALAEQAEPRFEVLTKRELAERVRVDGVSAYVLKTIPAGFTLKIVAVAGQPKGQPYQYEVNYTGAAGEHFDMQAVGMNEPGFVEANFYDGSYKTAAGMVLHYSVSSSDGQNGKTSTSAMLVALDGNSFLINSSLTREQVQALVENLVAVK